MALYTAVRTLQLSFTRCEWGTLCAVRRDDGELLKLALAADETAFGELLRRYHGKLVAYCAQIVGVQEEARDIAQEAFIRVWRNLDQYDPRFRFSTWLFRIAHNLSIDHLRRRRQRMVSLDSGIEDDGEGAAMDLADSRLGPLGDLENRELAKALLEQINGLQDSYRELVVLRHISGLSYNEIAEMKELPLGTVKNKLFRAHSVLREALAGFLGQVGGLT